MTKYLQSTPHFLLFLAISASMFQPQTAFHTTGHMVVARIAEINLEGTRMYKQMLDILGLLSPFTKERNYPFVEAAPWADDIKYTNVKSMSSWHFYDNYVNGTRPLTKTEIKNQGLLVSGGNLVWATNQAKTVLRNTKESLIDDRLNKSIYLRLLIHFYGDLHQPLHNTSLVSEDFPKGDGGGNKFAVDYPGAHDLHSLWDTCLKNYTDVKHPLTKKKFDFIDQIARKVMKDFPESNKRIKERVDVESVKEISLEGQQHAIDFVYNGIKVGGKPSQEYLERGRKLIDEQLAVAGYRLTKSMRKLFEQEDVLQKHVKESEWDEEDEDEGTLIEGAGIDSELAFQTLLA